jgi:hypothetical protein
MEKIYGVLFYLGHTFKLASMIKHMIKKMTYDDQKVTQSILIDDGYWNRVKGQHSINRCSDREMVKLVLWLCLAKVIGIPRPPICGTETSLCHLI